MKDQEYKKLFNELRSDITYIKNSLPNGAVEELAKDMKEISVTQVDIQKTVSNIDETINDPEEGLIVKVNKNTEFREETNELEDDVEEFIREHEGLVKYKKNVNRLLWIILTAIVGIVTKLIFWPE